LIRHLSYLVEKLGENSVALGSDFDGCQLPQQIGDVNGNTRLIKSMQEAQFGEALIQKICFDNWCDLLERTLKP